MYKMTDEQKLSRWMVEVGLEQVLAHKAVDESIEEGEITIFTFMFGTYKYTITHEKGIYNIER